MEAVATTETASGSDAVEEAMFGGGIMLIKVNLDNHTFRADAPILVLIFYLLVIMIRHVKRHN